MNWYSRALSKYADFGGRASREEYWYFVLFDILIAIALYVPMLVISVASEESPNLTMLAGVIAILFILYSFALIVPRLAAAARRLHDTGRSGWYQLISFIPVVGPIILLIFLVQAGDFERNQYGSNPRRPLL